jgi:hypothetical protein
MKRQFTFLFASGFLILLGFYAIAVGDWFVASSAAPSIQSERGQAERSTVTIPDQYIIVLRDDADALVHANAAAREYPIKAIRVSALSR